MCTLACDGIQCSTGVSPSGKAVVFGTTMRRFESFHPNHRSLERLFHSQSHFLCSFVLLRVHLDFFQKEIDEKLADAVKCIR